MPRRNPSPRRAPVTGGITHPCVFPECCTRVTRSQVCCPPDWARLPQRLKQQWNAARAEQDTAEQERILAAITSWARRDSADKRGVVA